MPTCVRPYSETKKIVVACVFHRHLILASAVVSFRDCTVEYYHGVSHGFLDTGQGPFAVIFNAPRYVINVIVQDGARLPFLFLPCQFYCLALVPLREALRAAKVAPSFTFEQEALRCYALLEFFRCVGDDDGHLARTLKSSCTKYRAGMCGIANALDSYRTSHKLSLSHVGPSPCGVCYGNAGGVSRLSYWSQS